MTPDTLTRARELAEKLTQQALDHFQVAVDQDMRPEDTCNWRHKVECTESAAMLRTLCEEVGRLESELARLRAAPAVPEWQPIETVPKDGLHVLVLTAHGMVRTARWSDHKSRWLVAYDKNYAATSAHDPTHWMPLPASPAAPSAQGSND